MTWLELALAALTGLAVLLFPGLPVSLMLGLRGLWAAAVAPLVSVSLWVMIAAILPIVGLRWGVVSAVMGAALLGAAVVLLFKCFPRARFSFSKPGDDVLSPRWVTPAAWTVGAAASAALFLIGIGDPTAISQTYDNIFHLNLLAFTEDTGNASALSAGLMVSPGSAVGFYPNGWHTLTSLTEMVAGVGYPIAVNGFNLAVLLVVWPAGMLLLVRQLVGSSPAVLLSSGVLLSVFPAMPLNLLTYGVLYPFFFGLALAPGVLALISQLVGVSRDARPSGPTGLTLLLVGALPGIAIAHPGALMAILAISVPLVVVGVISGWSTATLVKRIARLVGLGTFGAVGFVMLVRLRTSAESVWDPQYGLRESVWQTFGLGLLGFGVPLVTAALVLIGIFSVLRRPKPHTVALVLIWVVTALLFFSAAWAPFKKFRIFMLGAWYADTPRLAAIFVLALIPIAALGISQAWRQLSRTPRVSHVLSAILLCVALVATHISAGWPGFLSEMRFTYTTNKASPLISTDEQRLLERLPELVPEGNLIAGNPWTGTALAYALGGRRVLLPHVSVALTTEQAVALAGLRWAGQDTETCEAIEATRLFYALDFGSLEVHGATHPYPGLESLSESDGMDLIAQEGSAKLYRVTGCD